MTTFIPNLMQRFWWPGTREVRLDPRHETPLWTPGQTHIWKSATFTVPDTVAEDRVQFAADKYQRKAGAAWEKQGFQVLQMGLPELDRGVVAEGTTEPNRRAYIIWGKVRRRPVTERIEVPDKDVPILQKIGFKLLGY